MCITLKDIKQIIIDGLKPYANEIGFRARKASFELYRREKMRTVSLSFLYEGGYVEKRICPCMFFDFHIIEDICTKNGVNLYGSVLTIELLLFEAYRKYGYSWALKKEMAIKRTDIFEIFDEEECLAALEKIKSLLPLVLHYINRFDNMDALDGYFNKLPIQWSPAANIPLQSIAGLIASKLARNGKYEITKEAYFEKLKEEETDQEGLDNFFKIASFLESFSSAKDLYEAMGYPYPKS